MWQMLHTIGCQQERWVVAAEAEHSRIEAYLEQLLDAVANRWQARATNQNFCFIVDVFELDLHLGPFHTYPVKQTWG